MSHRSNRGVTLVELIITLTVMATLAAVVTVAIVERPRMEDRELDSLLTGARQRALETGRSVTIRLSVRGQPAFATALPDGRVVADAVLRVDPLTGRVRHAAR